MQIEKYKEVKLHNLLSCRKKVKQKDIDNEFASMAKFIAQNKLNQTGGVITTVYKIDTDNGLLDMEIMIPIEHTTENLNGYTIKPIFHLINALHLSYRGNPANLSSAHNEMYNYVKHNKLQPITPLYNYYSNKIGESQSIDELKVDVLLGINPSIL